MMKTFILLAAIMAVCRADNIAMSTTSNSDKLLKTYNSIPMAHKTADVYYAQQYQPQQYQSQQYQSQQYQSQQQQPQQPQYQATLAQAQAANAQAQSHPHSIPPSGYVQVIPRQAYYVPQASTPTAIMIIAQPALVPHQLIYGSNGIQQLLNYFHSNPQARYQLLHGTGAQQQQYVHAAHSVPQFQYIAAPAPIYQNQYANYIAVPAAHASASAPMYATHQQPTHLGGYHLQQAQPSPSSYSLNQLSHMAQLQANQLQQQQHAAFKTAPPIITGLENFSPEQQVQIKQQLQAQLGPITTYAGSGGAQAAAAAAAAYGTSKVLSSKASETSSEEKQESQFTPVVTAYRTISDSSVAQAGS